MDRLEVEQLTPEQKVAYLADSSHCPFCKSSDIEGGSVDVDAGGAWQEVGCNACGKSWNDFYRLVDVEAKE